MSSRLRSLLLSTVMVSLGVLLFGAAPRQDEKASLATAARAILKDNCFRCHGQNGVASKNVFVLDTARLHKDKTVVPGDRQSLLLQQVESDAMPLGGPKLKAEELETLRKWVAVGAPAVDEGEKPSRKRLFLTEAHLIQQIARDLENQEKRSRPYLRYYSIAHLSNAGVPDDELEGYRLGLSKLLNSLSWNRVIARATLIDPEKTLLRIDLRDFDWTPETWKTILSAYPYGLKTSESEHVTGLSGATLPYIHADWFVANASIWTCPV